MWTHKCDNICVYASDNSDDKGNNNNDNKK